MVAQPVQTIPGALAFIAANVAGVRRRIAAAAERSNRDPASITLIAVSKTVAPELCAAAVAAGVADLGENRVQEGVAKAAALAAGGIHPTWHLIGNLQTNKVKAALGTFRAIHSVDSLALAAAIDRRAVSPVACLLEVNVAGEASKAGFAPDEVVAALREIAPLNHVRVRGLMTVAPLAADPETVRPVFRQLRTLAGSLGLAELSMGMTGDFEVAIEEGATMVRVGRAIFGARPEPHHG